MLELYNNTLCIPAKELLDMDVVSRSNYHKMAERGKIDVVRQGKGKGNYALVAVGSLPTDLKTAVMRKYPNHNAILLQEWFKSNYILDEKALAYYCDSQACGVELSKEKINEYTNNASVLNACIKLYGNTKAIRKTMGASYDWEQMAHVVEFYKAEYKHTLPTSMTRFRKKVADYRKGGYEVLISGKFNNKNSRKVFKKETALVLSLARMDNKPFNGDVYQMYLAFVCGELDVYDPETGELYDCEDYTDKNGEPVVLSESTIANILNKPEHKLLVNKELDSYTRFYHDHAPHMHRHAPQYSGSKLSADDRDLPRKASNTKARPKAYYIYDVMSGAVIGYAHSPKKDTALVVDCFRNMFRLLNRLGAGVGQIEVENHLMSGWRDSFLQVGEIFPFVRFCAPQNSQEKYAEAMNGAKKKSVEHKNHAGVGRFYGKGKWRTEAIKVYDEHNDTYIDKNYYDWDELIADDVRDIEEFNNSPHPDKRWAGKTRWQVFVENLNPNLKPISQAKLAYYIGEKVQTSIRRNSYCRVLHKDWWLSGTEVLERLAPNNYEVDAYYIPNESGEADDIYIYQNGKYIDTLEDIGTYNRAEMERTEEDDRIFMRQQQKVAGFNRYLKDNAIKRVGVSHSGQQLKAIAQEVEAVEVVPAETNEWEEWSYADDYASRAVADL